MSANVATTPKKRKTGSRGSGSSGGGGVGNERADNSAIKISSTRRQTQIARERRNSRVYGEDYRVLRPLRIKLDTFRTEAGEEWRLRQPVVELDVSLPSQQHSTSTPTTASIVDQQQQQQQRTDDADNIDDRDGRVPIPTPTVSRPYLIYQLSNIEEGSFADTRW